MSSSSQASESTRVRVAIALLSAFVFLAVLLVMRVQPSGAGAGAGPSVLARINVGLNAGAGVFLALGYVFIQQRKIAQHRFCMLTAFGLSSAFLVTYLLHHAQVGSVPYRGQGWLRPLYYSILLPHVLLAAVIVPLALFTLYRAWTGDVSGHRRIARYTLPLWLFVSVSGVIVFAMLYAPAS